jgi:hypothetical protein
VDGSIWTRPDTYQAERASGEEPAQIVGATSGMQADHYRVVVPVASIHAVAGRTRERGSTSPESVQDAPREIVDVERVGRGLTESNVKSNMFGFEERRQAGPTREMRVACFAGSLSPAPVAAIWGRHDDASGPAQARMVVPQTSGHTWLTRTVGRQVRGGKYHLQLVLSDASLVDFDEHRSKLWRIETRVGAGICEVLAGELDPIIVAQRTLFPSPRIQPIVVIIVSL